MLSCSATLCLRQSKQGCLVLSWPFWIIGFQSLSDFSPHVCASGWIFRVKFLG